MPFNLEKIVLDTIDSSDHTCRISSPADPASINALADSIGRMGMFQAPLIHESESHRRIVSGFRRMAACRQLGWKSVFCKLAGSEMSDRQCAQLAVAENAWSRPLNLMEKARAFSLLESFYPESESLSTVARSLGLVENPAMIGKLIALTRLPEFIQLAVETGGLGLAMALTLGKLTTEESHRIWGLFQTFRFGLNRQREMLELIREIAKRESISIRRLLSSEAIQTILDRTDQDRPARGGALRRYLKQRRYPALIQRETEFEQLERKLALGGNIRLVPPPYFEGSTFQMIIRFATMTELTSHHQTIGRKMIKSDELKAFIDA